MNKYLRGVIVIPAGTIKMLWMKLFHLKDFSGPFICQISPHTEITLDWGGRLHIGNGFKMRDGAKIRVRRGAICEIGDNTAINSNNVIACREEVRIGSNVQLSPNVQIYDHDHDFRANGGIIEGKYRTAPVIIGDNVWIGCNSVILRGSNIGNNCVIGAGCIIKGNIPDNSLIIQKRESEIRQE